MIEFSEYGFIREYLAVRGGRVRDGVGVGTPPPRRSIPPRTRGETSIWGRSRGNRIEVLA